MKKIAVINDLSGLGKCSLTAALPVISVMGVQACPFPTAILSAQTGFGTYFYEDYTKHMDSMMESWKQLGFCPDGIYTGFLSGASQADKVLDFIRIFEREEVKILTDPIMGDNGAEYPIYSKELCEKMRLLAKKASVITPNLTEALLLLYGKEEMHIRWKQLAGLSRKEYMEAVETIGRSLVETYGAEAAITGIDLEAEGEKTMDEMANLLVNSNGCFWISAKKEGGSYSGTGDLFASVLSAGMVKGIPTEVSVKKAVGFLSKAIRDTVEEGTDRNQGVCFEKYLRELTEQSGASPF